MSERRFLRVYDHRDAAAGCSQPTGPIELDVAENATDSEIRAAIWRVEGQPDRPAAIRWNGGFVNRGWVLEYLDG